MTLEEILKSQGLTDEQVETITGEMKQNKIFTTGEENLDIRYNKLKGDFDNQGTQLGEANKLIEDLKKTNKGNEEMQGKITGYETTISSLQEQLKQVQLDSEIKIALLAAKAKCKNVVVADILDNRLALATEYGADAVVNTKTQSLEEFTKEFTNGNGFDVCIEACGAPETFLGCIDNAAFAANIILIGNGKRETSFIHSIILKKEFPELDLKFKELSKII